jgi:hypothetical protein
MRRVVGASTLIAMVALMSACSVVGPPRALAASPTPMVSADPTTTHTVCRDATTAVENTLTSFNADLDVIDRAAASGDQVSLMSAADAIQNGLLALATELTGWSQKPIPDAVRVALVHGAATLQAITATTYSGNQADIAQQLTDMSKTLTGACG